MKKSLLLLLIGMVACQPSQEKKETTSELTDTAPSQITTEQTAAQQEKTKQTPPARPDFPVGSVVYVLGKQTPNDTAPQEENHPPTEGFPLGSKLEIVGEDGTYYKVKKGAHEGYVLKSEVGYQDQAFSKEELEQVSTLFEYKGSTHIPKDLDNISEFFSISLITEEQYQGF